MIGPEGFWAIEMVVPPSLDRIPDHVRAEVEQWLRDGVGIHKTANRLRKKHYRGVHANLAPLTSRDVRSISKQIGTHAYNHTAPPEKVVNRNIKDNVRRRVNARDGMQCRYCGCTVFPQPWNGQRNDGYTLDHVLPVGRGGRNGRHNLVVACYSCNERKGMQTLEEAGMILLPVPSAR